MSNKDRLFVEETAGDKARKSFLRPGEKFIENVNERGIVGYGGSGSESLDEHLQTLRNSGNFEDVRVDPEAAFDNWGNPMPGHVAIFVIPRAKPFRPEID